MRQIQPKLKIAFLALRFHPRFVPVGSATAFLMSFLLRPVHQRLSFLLLCLSHRILMGSEQPGRPSIRLKGVIERKLQRTCVDGQLIAAVTALPRAAKESDWKNPDIAGLVLKAPRCEGTCVVEKGVLLLTNNDHLQIVRRHIDIASLLDRYVLVLEPSWSTYANPTLLSFCVFMDHPVVVMSPCRKDYEFLEGLGTNLRPISTGPSDWVDPNVFRPLAGREKRYDAVMISRWTVQKRHHLLFRAMRRIGDPSFRVALLAATGYSAIDRAAILEQIDALGLASQITIFEDVSPTRVNKILNESIVNLLLSRQEGAPRCLFEGFFAGVPGLAFANHLGLPKTHFTPQTGRLIEENELADALLYFRQHGSEFEPRSWAVEHIAPEVTTAKLNHVLKQLAVERNEPWTRDIVAKCNRPNARYYPDDRVGQGLPGMRDLIAQFPRRR